MWPWSSRQKSQKEKCYDEVRFYQRRWSTVPVLSSDDLLEKLRLPSRKEGHETLILVDVRSPGEREISMIPGAISLEDYRHQYQPSVNASSLETTRVVSTNASGSVTTTPAPTVVTYCTIGYRSGMEATHLLRQDPSLQGRIYNMDGILAYTHSLVGQENEESTRTDLSHSSVELVQPSTGHATRNVHAFASSWDFAPDEYTAHMFTGWTLIHQLLAVGRLVVVRFFQGLAHRILQCWLSIPSRSPRVEEEEKDHLE